MNLEHVNLSKTDEHLREALRKAKRDEPLQVVMVLDDSSSSKKSAEPKRSDYRTATDYRRELIRRRSLELAGGVGDTVKSLSDLDLEIRGGKLGRTVVATGPARQVVKSRSLTGVVSVTLDSPNELIGPRRRSRK